MYQWLNIRSLCESYLYTLSPNHKLEKIYYFSALAYHKSPDTVARHLEFLKCLRETGIIVELARFKEKRIECNFCHRTMIRHEEKETAVSIGLKLFEIFKQGECETAMLMTGDTDIAPALRMVKKYYPKGEIGFLFPYKRKNKELAQMANFSRNIKKERYIQYQFPDPFILSDGASIKKPISW
ncbi:MAG: NYN domain-containing protein [Ignavibacteriales bacterium]|nr:NYN domain-containing protein [Ignavibacteriales bacterium]